MSLDTLSIKPAVLVTIIGEAVLKDRIIKVLESLNVTGYTLSSEAQGAGRHGKRMGDIASFKTNIEIKTIVSPEVSEAILIMLEDYRQDRALIAFRHNVEALMD
jgi:hypothetical protein